MLLALSVTQMLVPSNPTPYGPPQVAIVAVRTSRRSQFLW